VGIMRRPVQNQIVDMRHRVKLQNKSGNVWQDLILAWAEAKPQTKGLQMYDSGVIIEKCNFTIRYRPEINQTMRLCYNGKFYEIDSITDLEARKRFMELSAHTTSYVHQFSVKRPTNQVTSAGETKLVDVLISSNNPCAVDRMNLVPGEQTPILNKQHYNLELTTSSDVDILAGDKLYVTVYGKTTYYIAGEPYVSRMNMKVPLLRDDEA
jgi:SPP1 family predicted phage head-tail adaptor